MRDKRYGVNGRQRPLIPIPSEEVPSGVQCIQLNIPDSDAAKRQLIGMLNLLGFWTSYEREASHLATQWAKAWRAALSTPLLEGCEMPTEIRVDDICTLSWSYDDWATFDSYDPSSCISAYIDSVVPGMINQAILDGIADGTIQQPGGQPGPTDPPPQGECETYHVVLRANERWKLPSVINNGDTLTVTNVRGGWTDGAFLWYCYDGKSYVLNTCGNNNAYQANDPVQAGNHMMLIGGYGETSPVYFQILTGEFVVPPGVNDQECWFQANDSVLYDNSGEIEFDVTVCTGAAWEYIYNAATNLSSWSIYQSHGVWTNPYWIASGNCPSCFLYVGIQLPINSGTVYDHVSCVATNGGAQDDVRLYASGLFSGTVMAHGPVSGVDFPDAYQGGHWLCVSPDVSQSFKGTLTSVTITGHGVNPFI